MVYPGNKEFKRQDVGRPKQRIFRDLSTLPRKIVLGGAALGIASLYAITHFRSTPLTVLSKVEGIHEGVRQRVARGTEALGRIGETKKKLRERISELERELQTREKEWVDVVQMREENEALRGVLPLVRERETVTVVAKPKPGNPFLFVTYPDAASLEHIDVGALAVAPQGFVGTVVAKDGPKVLLLLATQLQSRIPVRSRQSHQRALLQGRNSPFFAIKYAHLEDEEKGTSLETASEARPFIKEDNRKQDFVDGEILELCDAPIPVARVVRKKGKVLAEWLVQTPSKYITLVLK